MIDQDLLMTRAADISPCGRYRYSLTRRWSDAPLLAFVMLNPSIADADIDDPTIRRCMGFARREAFGGIRVANLFAFRATNPHDLWTEADPFGPFNDDALRRLADFDTPVVCGWGIHGGGNNHAIVLMQQAGADLRCLGRTKGGYPRHPLYVRADQPMEVFP